MRVKSLIPIIATSRLAESRDFYAKHLGFKVIFENNWYVQMRSAGEPPVDVAFVQPDHESQPPIFQLCVLRQGSNLHRRGGGRDPGIRPDEKLWHPDSARAV